jgi:hypothetical protein
LFLARICSVVICRYIFSHKLKIIQKKAAHGDMQAWEDIHHHFISHLTNDIDETTQMLDSGSQTPHSRSNTRKRARSLSAVAEMNAMEAIRDNLGFYMVATLACVFTCFQKPNVPSHFAFSTQNGYG